MAVAVTNIGGTSQNNVASATIVLTVGGSGVPAGALVAVTVYEGNTTGGIGTVTDSVGNTYTKITDLSPGASNSNGRAAVYYAYNVTALSSSDTITYTRNSSGVENCLLSALYATGVDTSNPLDTAVTNASSSASTSSPTVTSGTPGFPGELLVACTYWSSAATYTQDTTHSWSSPFASNTVGSVKGLAGGNQVNSGVGTTIYNPTLSFASPTAQIVVGFKPAGLTVGAAAGTGAASATGKSTFSGVASATSTATTSYKGTGIRNSVASASAVSVATGIGTTTSGTGSSSGIGSASGVGRSTAASTAAASVVATTTYVGTGVRNSVAAASSTASTAYVGTGARNSIGSAASTSTTSYVGRSTGSGIGSAAGTAAGVMTGVTISPLIDNPTFNGVVDGRSATEFMSVDGNDFFNEVSTGSWCADWHKPGAKWTLACIVYYTGGGADLRIIGNRSNFNDAGIQLLISSAGSLILRRSIDNHVSNEDYVLKTGLTAGWYFIGVSYNEAGGAAASHWRVGTSTGTFNGAATLITSAAASYKMRMLSNPDGTTMAPVGSKILTMNAWGRTLTATELSQLYTAMKSLRIGTI